MRFDLRGPSVQLADDFRRQTEARLKRAALAAADKGAKQAVDQIRSSMSGAGLGRLGRAIGSGSDQSKGRSVRLQGGGFSASGWIHVRGKSERTLGALEAYTEGATIVAKRGGWLWIATDQIPSRVGRYRMTPQRYRDAGLESRLGPLVEIPGRRPGERLLIVRNVSVRSADGRRARRLPKNGRARAGREVREQIVAFVGIRRTSRAARFDPMAILRAAQADLPRLIAENLKGA